MSGSHRAQETSKMRVAVAGTLTAGALLLAPVGAAVAMPGIANALPPGGCSTGPGTCGPTTPTTTKKIIRLPGLKIEIKNTVGDHKPPKIKVVPFPRLNHFLHPQTGPSVPPPPPSGDDDE